MAKDNEVLIAMRAGQTELKKDLDDIKRTIDNKFKSYKAPTGSWFSGVKASLSGIIAAVGGATAAFGFLKTSIQEAVNARKEFAKIETAVRQTGGAAGYSAKEIKGFADELEKVTGIDGGNVLNDVYAQLLTFTNIRGENFKKAGMAVLDLATVLDKTGDMKGQTIQLAKALENPIKGLAALTKAGITFTDSQEEVIRTMVTTGDTAGAQGVILDEISAKYGDQAKAIYEATGGLASYDVAVKQIQESVGEAALPTLIELNKALVTTLQKANESGTGISTLAATFKVLGLIVAGTAGWIQGIINVLAVFVGTVVAAGNVIASGFSTKSFDILERTMKTGLKNIKDDAGSTYETLKALYNAPAVNEPASGISGNSGNSGNSAGVSNKSEKGKYDELKWYSNEYYNERVQAINKEFEELKKSKDKSIDLELWYDDQITALNDELQKEILRRYGENAETLKQKKLKEEEDFNKMMLSDADQAESDLNDLVEEGLDRRAEAYNNYFSNLKAYQDEWVNYQVAKLEEELEGYKLIGIQKDEIDAMRAERTKEIEDQAFDAKWEKWKENNEALVAAGAVLQAGFQETFEVLFDSQLSGAEKVKKVFESMGKVALGVLSDILMGVITNAIKSAIIGQIQNAIAITTAVATGSAIAAAYAPAAAMASLASFGANAAPAAAGISSTVALAKGMAMAGMGLAKGGDFIVPPGYNNDSYPIRVQSFEKVSVTPANKVGQDLALLSDISNSIKAMNMNLVKKNMSVNIKSNIKALEFTKDVTYKSNNKLSNSGVKESDY